MLLKVALSPPDVTVIPPAVTEVKLLFELVKSVTLMSSAIKRFVTVSNVVTKFTTVSFVATKFATLIFVAAKAPVVILLAPIVPLTVRLKLGAVVPIPTFPPVVMIAPTVLEFDTAFKLFPKIKIVPVTVALVIKMLETVTSFINTFPLV